MLLSIIYIVIGLVVLIAGAKSLVSGASSLAAKLHISPLVIGLTVVSFGTSAPELTVNVISALEGSPDLALGNIIGSNIANILLVLGVCAVVGSINVERDALRKEIPLALFGSVLLLFMAQAFFIGIGESLMIIRLDGILLLIIMAGFLYHVFTISRQNQVTEALESIKSKIRRRNEPHDKIYPAWLATVLTIGGLVALTLGGRLLVTGAVDIARIAGLSEALIGLTIIAIGTSLPELATSLVAAFKKQSGIAIGNIVGSNIFNIFFVLGTTSVIAPLTVAAALLFDMYVAIAATVLLLIFAITGGKHRLLRYEGIILLLAYAAYITASIVRG